MCETVSIKILLYISLNDEFIGNLVDRAFELGLIFLDQKDTRLGNFANARELSKKEVNDSIKKVLSGGSLWDYIEVRYEDTFFSLSVSHEDDYAKLYMWVMCLNWSVKWHSKDIVDVDRYLRLLLDLCQGLPIKRIEAGEIGDD